MNSATPSFFHRVVLAWIASFRTLFDGQFAAGIARLRTGEPLPPPPALPAIEEQPEVSDSTPPSQRPSQRASRRPSKPVVLREATPDAACQLLSLLQREGRFLDFLQEDLAEATDGEIGAAARVVHQGCRQAVEQHFDIVPVLTEEEGRSITIDEGFDASEVRLTGNVVGEPPFRGTLSHRGWRAASVTMPQMTESHDARILAPAEVEI